MPVDSKLDIEGPSSDVGRPGGGRLVVCMFLCSTKESQSSTRVDVHTAAAMHARMHRGAFLFLTGQVRM